MKTTGERISELRKNKGMTQEALAEKLSVSAQAVSKWENDISCPDISLLPSLSDILGCTIDQLLTGKSDRVLAVPAEDRKPLEELVLRVRVNSSNGDKVRVNLPFPLVKWGIECGASFMPQTGAEDAMENIDWNGLVQMIQNGIVGKLVEVESADGDTVEIVVE